MKKLGWANLFYRLTREGEKDYLEPEKNPTAWSIRRFAVLRKLIEFRRGYEKSNNGNTRL
jgi:hypothetical protein